MQVLWQSASKKGKHLADFGKIFGKNQIKLKYILEISRKKNKSLKNMK